MKDRMQHKYKSRMMWLPLKSLTVNPAAQRRFIQAWADDIAANFDPDLFGIPLIVEIVGPHGSTFAITDGQHRCAGARKALGEDQQIECEVVSGISLERAAQLYRGRNRVKRNTALDDFRVGITAKHPETLAINAILTELGLAITMDGHTGLSCVTTLQKVFREDGKGDLLRSALGVLIDSWGITNTDCMQTHIIGGVAAFMQRYRSLYDSTALIRRLGGYAGGPIGLLGRARQIKEFAKNNLSVCVARAIVYAYNESRRGGKLPDWDASMPPFNGGNGHGGGGKSDGGTRREGLHERKPDDTRKSLNGVVALT